MSLPLARLSTVLITDGRGDPQRLRDIVLAAVAGGIRGVQLREPGMPVRQLAALCAEFKSSLAAAGALLIVNDRADVVAAGHADGVHLGHRSLRPSEVRRFLPPGAIVGCSAHDAAELRQGADADYIQLSPLFPTGCKPGVAPLGPAHAGHLVATSPRPVILLGGIDADSVLVARGIGACGVAVMSAVCDASDPRAAAAALCVPVCDTQT